MVLFDDTKTAITQRKHNIDAKIRENTPTCHVGTSGSPGCDVGTSGSPGRTALGGVSSLSRKCSSLQKEVRGFSSFSLFCDWAGGFDQVVYLLSTKLGPDCFYEEPVEC